MESTELLQEIKTGLGLFQGDFVLIQNLLLDRLAFLESLTLTTELAEPQSLDLLALLVENLSGCLEDFLNLLDQFANLGFSLGFSLLASDLFATFVLADLLFVLLSELFAMWVLF